MLLSWRPIFFIYDFFCNLWWTFLLQASSYFGTYSLCYIPTVFVSFSQFYLYVINFFNERNHSTFTFIHCFPYCLSSFWYSYISWSDRETDFIVTITAAYIISFNIALLIFVYVFIKFLMAGCAYFSCSNFMVQFGFGEFLPQVDFFFCSSDYLIIFS